MKGGEYSRTAFGSYELTLFVRMALHHNPPSRPHGSFCAVCGEGAAQIGEERVIAAIHMTFFTLSHLCTFFGPELFHLFFQCV